MSNIKKIGILVSAAFSLLLLGCVREEWQEKPGTISFRADLTAVTGKTSYLGGGKTGWVEGDVIRYYSDKDSQIKQFEVTESGSSTTMVAKVPDGTESLVAVYGGSSVSDFSAFGFKLNGAVSSVQTGRFEDAHVCVAKTTEIANGASLCFRNLTSMLKFSLESQDISYIVFSATGNEMIQGGGQISVSFSENEPSASYGEGGGSSIRINTSGAGTYYISTLPVILSKGFSIEFFNSADESLGTAEGTGQYTLPSNTIIDIGCLDSKTDPQELVVMIWFKQGEDPRIYDAPPAWPFVEDRGTSGKHAGGTSVFHTLAGNYPVVANVGEYYLNSRGGWQFYPKNTTDYLEVPTFANGRLKYVDLVVGGNAFNPYFTDASGQILSGGEKMPSIQSAAWYRYTFPDLKMGEPCRMVFDQTKTCQMMEITAYYDISGIVTSRVKSVDVKDPSNLMFGKMSGTIETVVELEEGTDPSSIRSGIDIFDKNGKLIAGKVLSAPDFRTSVDGLTGDSYSARAWAVSPTGFRVHSELLSFATNEIRLSFWNNGSLVSPFTSATDLKSGASEASLESGAEKSRVIEGTEITVRTFAPSIGSSYYFDKNSSAGLRVASSGEDESKMTYIKFPAIEGKALSGVRVKMSPGTTGTDFFLCTDPSSLEKAVESRMSGTITINADSEETVSCDPSYCIAPPSNTAACLVFSNRATYCIRSISAIYEDSTVPPKGGEEPDDPTADPVGAFNYSVLNSMGHPRLLINRAGFEDIKTKITSGKSSNVFLADISATIVSIANGFVSNPAKITYKLDASGKRLLSQSQGAFKQLAVLSYAYRITGRSKYLDAARIILNDVCAFPDWHPTNFLDTGEMCLGVALAYDWLYDALTLEEKILIHSRIRDYALLPSFGQQFHGMKNNWNQVCNAGLIAGSLAIYEKDKTISAQVIDAGIESNREAMSYIYSPDGNYGEGYDYWGYGTGFEVWMLQMLESAFGTTLDLAETPGFMKTAGFMLYMVGPQGPFSYSDGGKETESMMPGMWWFARKLNDKSLLINEMRSYKMGLYSSNGADCRLLPLVPAVVKDFNVDDMSSVKPSRNYWVGHGVTPVMMVHTGWDFNAKDVYLGIKGGAADGSHGHMDAGSFVFDADGCRWSCDVVRGTYTDLEIEFEKIGQKFSRLEQDSFRWDVVGMNNLQHSTISVGASVFVQDVPRVHPSDHYVHRSADITQLIDNASEIGAILDMSGTLLGQVENASRTIKLVDNRKLVIIDIITALPSLDAPVIWNMVTPAVVSASSAGVILSNSGKTMYLSTVISGVPDTPQYFGSQMSRPSTWEPRTWDPEYDVRCTGFTITVPAGRTVTMTTTLSPDSPKPGSTTEPYQEGQWNY